MGVGQLDDAERGAATHDSWAGGMRRIPAAYALTLWMALIAAAVAALIDVIARVVVDPLTIHSLGPVHVTHIEHLTRTMDVGHDLLVSLAVVVFAGWLVAVHAVFGRRWWGTRLGVLPGAALIVGGILGHGLLEVFSGGVPDWLILGTPLDNRFNAFDAGDIAILAGCALAGAGALAAAVEAIVNRFGGGPGPDGGSGAAPRFG